VHIPKLQTQQKYRQTGVIEPKLALATLSQTITLMTQLNQAINLTK
jgi:hypothetical protein